MVECETEGSVIQIAVFGSMPAAPADVSFPPLLAWDGKVVKEAGSRQWEEVGQDPEETVLWNELLRPGPSQLPSLVVDRRWQVRGRQRADLLGPHLFQASTSHLLRLPGCSLLFKVGSQVEVVKAPSRHQGPPEGRLDPTQVKLRPVCSPLFQDSWSTPGCNEKHRSRRSHIQGTTTYCRCSHPVQMELTSKIGPRQYTAPVCLGCNKPASLLGPRLGWQVILCFLFYYDSAV